MCVGAALRERGAAGEVDDVVDVRGAHDPLVVDRQVREQVVGVVVLEVVGADQVVVGHPGDGQQRRALELGVEQPVGEVDRARARGGKAHAELAGELRVAHRGHRADLLVADVDVADLASWRLRSASMNPLMPSPGRPKIVSTPQSIRRSRKRSEAVSGMCSAPCR